MNPELFDQTVRGIVQRKPFRPFVAILKDGRQILLLKPNIAFGGGVAGFIDEDEGLVDFSWEEVKEFRNLVPEPAK